MTIKKWDLYGSINEIVRLSEKLNNFVNGDEVLGDPTLKET